MGNSFSSIMLGFEMAEGGTPDVNFGTLPSQARRLINGYPNFEYQLREYCLSGRRHMTILLCGKTGVGKSHLTNALIGKDLAKEGEDLDPETDEVSDFGQEKSSLFYTCYTE